MTTKKPADRTKRTPKKGARPGRAAAAFDPWRDRWDAVDRLLEAREGGATLRQAAAAAGVHVATVCRWQLRCPLLARSLEFAAGDAKVIRYARRPRYRPRVPAHPGCPACGSPSAVRAVEAGNPRGCWGLVFWRCSRWPACRWASWRPRHPEDCSNCGGPRFWSHSRKSVSCWACRVRTTVH
jgi:hypothetical protein